MSRRRRPTLPGVQKDVASLLNGSEDSHAQAPTPAPLREPPFGEDRPLPADRPVSSSRPDPDPAKEIDRAALAALASQFPSAGPQAKPKEAPIEPTPPSRPASTASHAMESLSSPIIAVPRPAQPSGMTGQLIDALYGNDDKRRWTVIGGAVAIALLIVVVVDVFRPERRPPPVAQPPVAVAAAPAPAPAVAPAPAPPPVVVETPAMRAERAALSAWRLHGQAIAGRPFATELATLKRNAGESGPYAAILAQIEPMAATGVPTRADLVGRFATETPAMIAAVVEPPREGALARLGGMLSRRPSAEAVTRATLQRAQAALDAGNFDAALAEVGQATTVPPEMVASWVAAVRQRESLDQALTELMAVAYRSIATGS